MQDPGAPAAAPQAIELDPLSLLLHASGPVRLVNYSLIAAAIAVWVVAVLKLRQLGRLRAAERLFEAEAGQAHAAGQLAEIARRYREAPGARVALSVLTRSDEPELAEARAKSAIVVEEQRTGSLLGVLSTVGSAGPFLGLFGTVWGILDAFLRIGREKSASLPVVAPAIGEALISTAMGLFAAIPAVVLFNIASKRQDDLLAGVEAASGAWVVLSKRSVDMEEATFPAPAVTSRGAAPWPEPR
jgi:biopolymer transport protein TolQ